MAGFIQETHCDRPSSSEPPGGERQGHQRMTARFDPFAGSGPRWHAVPAHRPFLEDLAWGVLDWLGDRAPETLSDAVILLPNRRAARDFTRALPRSRATAPSCCRRSARSAIWKRMNRPSRPANWASTSPPPSPP